MSRASVSIVIVLPPPPHANRVLHTFPLWVAFCSFRTLECTTIDKDKRTEKFQIHDPIFSAREPIFSQVSQDICFSFSRYCTTTLLYCLLYPSFPEEEIGYLGVHFVSFQTFGAEIHFIHRPPRSSLKFMPSFFYVYPVRHPQQRLRRKVFFFFGVIFRPELKDFKSQFQTKNVFKL